MTFSIRKSAALFHAHEEALGQCFVHFISIALFPLQCTLNLGTLCQQPSARQAFFFLIG